MQHYYYYHYYYCTGEVSFLLSNRSKWSEEQQFNESSNSYLPNGHHRSKMLSHLEMIARTKIIYEKVMNLGCVWGLCVKPTFWEIFKQIQIVLTAHEDSKQLYHSWYSCYSESIFLSCMFPLSGKTSFWICMEEHEQKTQLSGNLLF